MISAALLVRPCVLAFQQPTGPVGNLLLAFTAFVFAAAFSVALLAFFVMHMRLVARNQTTIEAFEKAPIVYAEKGWCWW